MTKRVRVVSVLVVGAVALAAAILVLAGRGGDEQGDGDRRTGSPDDRAGRPTCDDTVGPSELKGKVVGAADGATLCLKSGSYGHTLFTTKRSTFVTLRPAPDATVKLYPDVDGATFLRFDGFAGASALTEAEVRGPSHHIEFINSRFTSAVKIQTGEFPRPETPAGNVLMDHNTHLGQDVCEGCQTGRISLPNRREEWTSGVTIRNSVFGDGGDADGILNGSNGTQIVNNTFRDLRQCGDCPAHTDSIQLSGSKNTIIRGNYVYGSEVAVMAPDGGEHERIEHNVFVGNGSYRAAIQLGSHVGTIFRHNTLKDIDAQVDRKANAAVDSSGVVMQDNMMVNSSFDERLDAGTDVCNRCLQDHNVFTSGEHAGGRNALTGTPTFVGGAFPRTFPGWALADGSIGKNAASDGSDVGADVRRFTGGPE